VDESLFGGSETNSARGSLRGGKKVTANPSSAAVIMSESDLTKIRTAAEIKTERQLIEEKEERERVKAEKEHLARSRKERMIALNAHAKKNVKKSDIEVAAMAKAAQLRKMGLEQRDKDSDVIKLLSSYASRASAFSVRDAQLEDREQRIAKERAYDRRMDTLMEVDRLNDLRRREDEERAKQVARLEDSKVLMEQIAMRERARMLAEEAKEQEAQSIKAKMQRYKDQELEEEKVRKVELEKSRLEVMKANEAAIAKKRADREFEKKEIADILLYQAEQDAKMAAREAEEAELERAKNERQKKLLDMQEKSQNKAAEMDELRARRAMEEKERIARRKERDEALKRRNDTITLLAEREKQALDKKKQQELERQRDHYEWQKQIEYSMRTANRDADEAAAKHNANYRHRDLLMEQIHSDEERKKASRGDELTAGTKFRQELVADEARFSTLRDQMVEDLIRKGVNPKYVTDMQKLDVGKILRR